MEESEEKGADFYVEIEALNVHEKWKPYIIRWIENNIFDEQGNVVALENGKLVRKYVNQKYARLYYGLPKQVIQLLHRADILRLWGRVETNYTSISYKEYEQCGNRIIWYARYKPILPSNSLTYEKDVAFFKRLLGVFTSTDDEYKFLLSYCAAIVQKKDYTQKTERLIILYSLSQGVGKGVLCNTLIGIVNGAMVSPTVLHSQFNCMRLPLNNLTVIDEGENLTHHDYSVIKSLITASRVDTPVKYQVNNVKLPASMEAIITLNKKPSTIRNQTNRRDILFESQPMSKKRRAELFGDFQMTDTYLGNIAIFLQGVDVDWKFIRTFQQVDCSNQTAVNEIQAMFKAFCEYKVLPLASDRLQGDYLLQEWNDEESIDTKMTRRDWYNLFKDYSHLMGTHSIIGYRFFIEEFKRICGNAVDISGDSVKFQARWQFQENYLSIFVRDSFTDRKQVSKMTVTRFLNLL